jgi:hypothetical protein
VAALSLVTLVVIRFVPHLPFWEEKMQSYIAALFGAGFQELLHWYELRNKLDSRKYKRLTRGKNYWLLTGLVILASSFGTAFFFGSKIGPFELALLSAAFPTVFRKFVTSVKQRNVKLGEEDESSTADLYFS